MTVLWKAVGLGALAVVGAWGFVVILWLGDWWDERKTLRSVHEHRKFTSGEIAEMRANAIADHKRNPGVWR